MAVAAEHVPVMFQDVCRAMIHAVQIPAYSAPIPPDVCHWTLPIWIPSLYLGLHRPAVHALFYLSLFGFLTGLVRSEHGRFVLSFAVATHAMTRTILRPSCIICTPILSYPSQLSSFRWNAHRLQFILTLSPAISQLTGSSRSMDD